MVQVLGKKISLLKNWFKLTSHFRKCCDKLTLSMSDCSTEGTSGNTSYKDDTYVMTDFSSGSGTSTSKTDTVTVIKYSLSEPLLATMISADYGWIAPIRKNS